MMKKIIICLLLTLAFVVLGQRQIQRMIVDAARGAMMPEESAGPAQTEESFSDQMAVREAADLMDITLYYRCKDTALLSARQVQLDIRREETIATSIVRQLLDGPKQASGMLEGLFPRETKLISVAAEGATVFVTLSRSFLGRPDGAPADWEDLTLWQEEAALRRMLAVQSLVLSLTEDGRYQRVQVYIADNDDDVPERIPLVYFGVDDTSSGAVLAACSRDESFLLTPQRVLNKALDCWQKRDYPALYAMLVGGRETLPSQAAFETRMRELDVSLLEYETTTGSVSFDGKRSTLVLSAVTRSPKGGETQLQREAIPLHREAENWVLTYDTLLSLMIRD
ncbi:MAG: GerMN domain-containing protein [Clostridia bacterium]|nr:GerMN domain-containing protein [Clostridia bacterium]